MLNKSQENLGILPVCVCVCAPHTKTFTSIECSHCTELSVTCIMDSIFSSSKLKVQLPAT